jgi:hypothetical protein
MALLHRPMHTAETVKGGPSKEPCSHIIKKARAQWTLVREDFAVIIRIFSKSSQWSRFMLGIKLGPKINFGRPTLRPVGGVSTTTNDQLFTLHHSDDGPLNWSVTEVSQQWCNRQSTPHNKSYSVI